MEVLPFHQMGRDKWDGSAWPYQLRATPPPDVALVDRVRTQFRDHGLTVS